MTLNQSINNKQLKNASCLIGIKKKTGARLQETGRPICRIAVVERGLPNSRPALGSWFAPRGLNRRSGDASETPIRRPDKRLASPVGAVPDRPKRIAANGASRSRNPPAPAQCLTAGTRSAASRPNHSPGHPGKAPGRRFGPGRPVRTPKDPDLRPQPHPPQNLPDASTVPVARFSSSPSGLQSAPPRFGVNTRRRFRKPEGPCRGTGSWRTRSRHPASFRPNSRCLEGVGRIQPKNTKWP